MPENTFKGIPASDGIAMGPTFCYIPADLAIPVCASGNSGGGDVSLRYRPRTGSYRVAEPV